MLAIFSLSKPRCCYSETWQPPYYQISGWKPGLGQIRCWGICVRFFKMQPIVLKFCFVSLSYTPLKIHKAISPPPDFLLLEVGSNIIPTDYDNINYKFMYRCRAIWSHFSFDLLLLKAPSIIVVYVTQGYLWESTLFNGAKVMCTPVFEYILCMWYVPRDLRYDYSRDQNCEYKYLAAAPAHVAYIKGLLSSQ